MTKHLITIKFLRLFRVTVSFAAKREALVKSPLFLLQAGWRRVTN